MVFREGNGNMLLWEPVSPYRFQKSQLQPRFILILSDGGAREGTTVGSADTKGRSESCGDENNLSDPTVQPTALLLLLLLLLSLFGL
jgi:hypothetical protein